MKTKEQVRILRNSIKRRGEWYEIDYEVKFLESIIKTEAEEKRRKIIKKASAGLVIGEKEAEVIGKITGVRVEYQEELKIWSRRHDK